MKTTAYRLRSRLYAALLLIAILAAIPSAPLRPALAAGGETSGALASQSAVPSSALSDQATHTTLYFTIYYPKGEEKTAAWYAGFVDEVDSAVSELLGTDPVENMSLFIYATEPDYFRANPMAEQHPGILAHAIPERKEIGVAVERLRDQPPALARESFRHEITHIVAGALTDQRLPVGFQEGLAQYDELSSTRGQEVVQGIQAAQVAGTSFLSWSDLNDADMFRQNITVAYPQSYTVMSFLADRYGMEPFIRFIEGLHRGLDYRHSLLVAYSKPMDDLEKEWRDYLPGFLQAGWKHNVLSAHDLGYGLAMMDAGQFTDAKEHFAASQRLYTDLGRPDRAEQATKYLASATRAAAADALAAQARKDLEAHDYSAAYMGATSASQAFADVSLPDYQQHASAISIQAQKGLDGIAKIGRARSELGSFNFGAAGSEASEAGQLFSSLGDAPRVFQANALLAEASEWQRSVGYAVAGAGIVLLTGVSVVGGLALRRAHKRRARSTDIVAHPLLKEENQSWL